MSGLFSSLIDAGVSSERDPNDDFWFTPLMGPATPAGVNVTHARAMQLTTVLSCVKLIAETEASLPLHMYHRLDNGDKERLRDSPIEELLHDRPNSEHTAVEFREMMMAWTLLRGTAIAEIIPGPRGAVQELIPIHPDHWRPVRGERRGEWFIEVQEPSAPRTVRPREEYFVLRALVTQPDSMMGLDPINAARHAIGAAIAVQDYAARFFANDAQQGGIIKHPGHFKTESDRDRFRRGWQAQSTGSNAHQTRVLEHGMEFATSSMTNEQAQFLETKKYDDLSICRLFRAQPHKVGILDRATFSNIEQQAIEFVTDTMLPWLVRFEQAVKRDLFIGRQMRSMFVDHNVNGLLRGETLARYRAYAMGRNWGWLSANDVRRLENMNSIGNDGDEYLRPTNMTPTDAPEQEADRAAAEDEHRQRLAAGFKPNGGAIWQRN